MTQLGPGKISGRSAMSRTQMDEPTTIQRQVDPSDARSVHPVRLVVFAVMSAGFLLWVAFGYVEARVWVSGRLTMLDRRISSMWQYLGNNLPALPAPGLFSMVFWLSISFVVIGTVAGLWLFLGTPDGDTDDHAVDVIHAAHLQHESE
jgi:hypothetical protein